MELESVPGVGAKTAEALASLEDAERALAEGDVTTLARAPGISESRAARIARAAIRTRHDDHGDFLATDRTHEIYRETLGLLQERTVTDDAAARLRTLYPSAATSRIREVRAFTREALSREPDPAVLEALEGVKPLETPDDVRVRDRCLVTGDAERYAEARDAIPEVSIEVVDDARQLAELARSYATVIVLAEAFAGVDVEGDVRVQPDALDQPAEVVPERTLSFFATNREPLQAAIAVHRAADLESPCDLDALESALAMLDKDGTPRGDDELDRLATAVDDLDAAVATAESVANDHLREAIEERDVTIEGTDLLSLVERGAGVDSLLSRELADEYDAAVAAARDHLVDALGLEDTEAIARRAFPDEPTYPVEHTESVVARLREELTTARDRRATRLKRDLAGDLADLRPAARDLVNAALELDVELAVARFAEDFDCTLPVIDSLGAPENGSPPPEPDAMVGGGIAIEGGRSPLLDVPFEGVEPVDYYVSGVALLSGVNSGGKTSTLDLIALVVVLAHMGLPVPADAARVQRIDELHYYAKTQGTLDAGAFESTLREFGDLVTGVAEDRETLVLVDELESITEPGASANIMAGILEALSARGATAVFVSHLAGEIRDVASIDIAVDGIEAVGLEDGELIVDRSPVKGTLARSTPELIVEKLAADGDGFYERLLEKFEQ
ncbi:helix-hairpin-helix domain-containing protein [Halapricum hydrolyticum]|uniref:DNA-binding protein MutS2 n=1 Tax=Halapricum hydrolyticum TaxID=2979991 RepID=A0AAE3IC22_9EURY|nr:helix-hairpin-helix domain-containing protein [Halapricum hydrolyticum]MCU4717879.1 helix-hairpin-helix domain-containing protein [Halapricum hydrolyticum]MCU4727044.1 helix-hairpin-helix domain-containing protein [Halapricum hydrolyticum]